jgi:hypothetical protein
MERKVPLRLSGSGFRSWLSCARAGRVLVRRGGRGGRFGGSPSRQELDRVFFLDDADRELIGERRGAPNQLGFALQLTTVRWLGTFLPDPTDVPPVVVAYVARQLEIEDPSCVVRYLERRRTRFEHAEEIKASEGLRDFAAVAGEFEEWIAARAYMSGDGPL